MSVLKQCSIGKLKLDNKTTQKDLLLDAQGMHSHFFQLKLS